ncbi:MAG: DUF1501 domain-containing protein [Planctomycetaceae bacterium]|nr:DUF1501 domain-containing protein [Planctomycetaceae bacterium]
MRYEHHMQLAMHRQGVVRRRDFLKGISAASIAAGTLSWTDLMSVHAGDLRKRGMACIVLWMQGGPSQFETFSPKPGHENGGETKAIQTSVPGIEIAEGLPHLAQVMDDLAIVRSMTTKEGNHQRASFLLHTGYAPTASVKHPTFGAIAAHQLPNPECDLPSFVRIGNQFRNSGGGGFLGAEFDAFGLPSAEQMPANTQPTTSSERFSRRLGLLGRLEADAANGSTAPFAADHRKLYDKASRMILSPAMKTFNIEDEPEAIRTAYGESDFATGCLMARRLVEAGVTFVEVSTGNWDTHNDNWPRTAELKAQIDQPFAQLLRDLKQRGLLETTLVVWMGEFGRTPRINPRGGRDHYPKAFNVALAGGGVRGGRVIGATDPSGAEVSDRPVAVTDLFQTFCRSLKIDAAHENMSPIGRPIKIVNGGSPVEELFA